MLRSPDLSKTLKETSKTTSKSVYLPTYLSSYLSIYPPTYLSTCQWLKPILTLVHMSVGRARNVPMDDIFLNLLMFNCYKWSEDVVSSWFVAKVPSSHCFFHFFRPSSAGFNSVVTFKRLWECMHYLLSVSQSMASQLSTPFFDLSLCFRPSRAFSPRLYFNTWYGPFALASPL